MVCTNACRERSVQDVAYSCDANAQDTKNGASDVSNCKDAIRRHRLIDRCPRRPRLASDDAHWASPVRIVVWKGLDHAPMIKCSLALASLVAAGYVLGMTTARRNI